MGVAVETSGNICTVIINRPEGRNAVDRPTAEQLYAAFRDFDADGDLSVAVLCGEGGTFCAGADLKAIAGGDLGRVNPLNEDMAEIAPLGPTRLRLSSLMSTLQDRQSITKTRTITAELSISKSPSSNGRLWKATAAEFRSPKVSDSSG